MDNKKLKDLIQRVRNEHAEHSWHEQECCASEVMDEIEQMIYADEEAKIEASKPKD